MDALGSEQTRYSIIIPVKAVNNYIRETVSHILGLYKKDWELIILPNGKDPDEWHDPRISLVSSGRVGPAAKRDMGATLAKGEILVFLDDDSYPEPDLLDWADRYFKDEAVVALGGPAITPAQDSLWQKVSGAVFLSRFSGGIPERYIPLGQVRQVDDWPSVNLMVRKQDFLDIGGFDSPYWPGEDTKLCLDLIEKTGKQILYVPKMRVWHHRRPGLAAHLRQVGAYGLHRGFFAKKYPKTSFKLVYFMPSAFVFFVGLSLVAPLIFPGLNWAIFLGWGVYGGAMVRAWMDMHRYEKAAVASLAIVYTVLSHGWYGLRFLQGFFQPKLISRLR